MWRCHDLILLQACDFQYQQHLAGVALGRWACNGGLRLWSGAPEGDIPAGLPFLPCGSKRLRSGDLPFVPGLSLRSMLIAAAALVLCLLFEEQRGRGE
ncbi:hypothetical protein AAFF_G00433020 [Aldrovandia affinis]|uniref:Uncharacterized protein n=1 Tax=Aldrovandia affinis TaxID=143900 RepID=A0AAD7S8K6_9TELE|nr:hypothetical protein AAFF_G00433020 [Aldrovandia affinis]